MELNYLIYFRTVAQTEHISQAAAGCISRSRP